MSCLNGQDSARGSQDGRRGEQWRGAEIRGDADGLEHGCDGDHLGGGGEGEVVDAGCDWNYACAGDGGEQCRDVGLLS